jgi:hypothetical protein
LAVLALGFIGTAIGGAIGGTVLGVSAAAIGGFIGSSIGSYIDQNFIFAAHVEGPRLNDLTVQQSTYGQPIPRFFGPNCLAAGQVIWCTDLIETKTTKSAKGGPTITTFSYRMSLAVLHCEGSAIGVKKIWANGKLIYDRDAVPTQSVFDTLAFYPGDGTQNPDPLIESYLGVGEAQSYRFRAYSVIKDLQLADYGNRAPNLVFLIEKDSTLTYAQACTQISELCGITTPLLPCDLPGLIDGYVIGSNSNGIQALQPLSTAGNFDVVDDDGILEFIERSGIPVDYVSINDLGEHEVGQDAPQPITFSEPTNTTLPRSATITFMDPARDFQTNAAKASRSTGSSDSDLSMDLPMSLTPDQARAIADRVLWETVNSRGARCSTGLRLRKIKTGCVYLFMTPAGLEPFRIVTKTRGVNGVVNLEMRQERAEFYTSTAPGAPASIPSNSVDTPPPTELFLLDIPLLRDQDDDEGFYFAVTKSGDHWRGSDVKRALNISADFMEVAPDGVYAVAGSITGTAPDGPTDDFDEDTILRVTLRDPNMILESVDDEHLDSGFNACFLGNIDDTPNGEIAQFGVATLVSHGVYDLSHWKRGRKGTEFATSIHGTGEVFIILSTDGSLLRTNYGATDLNLERVYKGVSLLTSEDDATPIYFTNTGVGKRPYAPVDLDTSGATGDDHVLSWTRRSRLSSGVLAEETEGYRVEIMNPPGESAGDIVLRTTDVTSPTFTYTAAMQTADFGGVVSDLRWRVAQISAIYGPGIFAEWSRPISS